jgi:hypothetical protein
MFHQPDYLLTTRDTVARYWQVILSALAAISEEGSEQLRPNLLPHKVTLDLETSIPTRGSSFCIYRRSS